MCRLLRERFVVNEAAGSAAVQTAMLARSIQEHNFLAKIRAPQSSLKVNFGAKQSRASQLRKVGSKRKKGPHEGVPDEYAYLMACSSGSCDFVKILLENSQNHIHWCGG